MSRDNRSQNFGLNALSAIEAGRQIASGEITSEALVRACLDRIAIREPEVQAWDFIDPDMVLKQAKALDRQKRRSPLHGVPIAIKDIFDTFDMPTAHGFPPYAGQLSAFDSYCVATMRSAGLVMLGKSVTTEFACPFPRRTRNPANLGYSPGVSSSGSAAAVADLMAPVALGSQTGGSIIVPAAFCGVYGYKSSPGAVDRAGYRHCKPSLDSIGYFARSMDDLILLRSLSGCGREAVAQNGPLRIGVVTATRWRDVDPAMAQAMTFTENATRKAGAHVSHIGLPDSLVDIDADFGVVNGWESAQVLKNEIRDHAGAFNEFNRRKAEAIKSLRREDYWSAITRVRGRQSKLRSMAQDFDVLLLPSAPGEALPLNDQPVPDDFAKFWSLMQLPAASLPLFMGERGLPLGIQVIGAIADDAALLAAARWIDACVRSAR